jgi:hypothetical protein
MSDAAGFLADERAWARANDRLARPLPIIPCVVGDGSGNVYPDETWDFVLVRPHHAGARTVMAQTRRRDLIEGQIVQCQFQADRGPALMKVLGRPRQVTTLYIGLSASDGVRSQILLYNGATFTDIAASLPDDRRVRAWITDMKWLNGALWVCSEEMVLGGPYNENPCLHRYLDGVWTVWPTFPHADFREQAHVHLFQGEVFVSTDDVAGGSEPGQGAYMYRLEDPSLGAGLLLVAARPVQFGPFRQHSFGQSVEVNPAGTPELIIVPTRDGAGVYRWAGPGEMLPIEIFRDDAGSFGTFGPLLQFEGMLYAGTGRNEVVRSATYGVTWTLDHSFYIDSTFKAGAIVSLVEHQGRMYAASNFIQSGLTGPYSTEIHVLNPSGTWETFPWYSAPRYSGITGVDAGIISLASDQRNLYYGVGARFRWQAVSNPLAPKLYRLDTNEFGTGADAVLVGEWDASYSVSNLLAVTT